MTDQTFTTPDPLRLSVEIGSGSVTVRATETTETTVALAGPGAPDTTVHLSGRDLRIEGPRKPAFFRDQSVDVTVTLPEASELSVQSGSADIVTTGALSTAEIRTGSGEIAMESVDAVSIKTGSGDVELGTVGGDVSVKTGSGDVTLGRVGGETLVSTGSGNIVIREATGPAAGKTGSGDLLVELAHNDVSFASGSGDLAVRRIQRGRVTLKGASSGARIGVAAGTPVWTDISCVSGRVTSDLEALGAPEEGQDHVEIRATTVSGHIHLQHV